MESDKLITSMALLNGDPWRTRRTDRWSTDGPRADEWLYPIQCQHHWAGCQSVWFSTSWHYFRKKFPKSWLQKSSDLPTVNTKSSVSHSCIEVEGISHLLLWWAVIKTKVEKKSSSGSLLRRLCGHSHSRSARQPSCPAHALWVDRERESGTAGVGCSTVCFKKGFMQLTWHTSMKQKAWRCFHMSCSQTALYFLIVFLLGRWHLAPPLVLRSRF